MSNASHSTELAFTVVSYQVTVNSITLYIHSFITDPIAAQRDRFSPEHILQQAISHTLNPLVTLKERVPLYSALKSFLTISGPSVLIPMARPTSFNAYYIHPFLHKTNNTFFTLQL